MTQKRAVQKQVDKALKTVSRAGKKKNPASTAPTATSSVKKPRKALQLWMEEKAASLADSFKLAKAANPEQWNRPGSYMRYAAERWREVGDKSEWEEWAAEDRLRYRVQKEDEGEAGAAKH